MIISISSSNKTKKNSWRDKDFLTYVIKEVLGPVHALDGAVRCVI